MKFFLMYALDIGALTIGFGFVGNLVGYLRSGLVGCLDICFVSAKLMRCIEIGHDPVPRLYECT